MKRLSLALLTCAVTLSACDDSSTGPTPDTPPEIFEAVWQDFDRLYPYFVHKNIDWNALRARHGAGLTEQSSAFELFDALGDMLVELHDVHVNIRSSFEQRAYRAHVAAPRFFDEQIVFSRYVSGAQTAPSRHLRYGRIDGDIGYVYIPNFSESGWAGEIDAILAVFEDVRGLIIDVRNNPGGSDVNALGVAGRFADQTRVRGYVRFRNGPAHTDLTDFQPQQVTPQGSRRFTKPVVVLTNRGVFSSGEDFVLMMRVLPQVTVLGDTTGGGTGNPIQRMLPNGWTYQVSRWIGYDEERVPFEDRGLIPDVVVLGGATDAQDGRDTILERALSRLAASTAASLSVHRR